MNIPWKTCFRLIISIFLLYLGITYWKEVACFLIDVLDAASPLLIGAVIAYILNIVMSSYEKIFFSKSTKPITIKLRRPVCLCLAIISVVGITALIGRLVVPQLISCIKLIFAELPAGITVLIERLGAWELLPENILEFLSTIDWESMIEQIANFVTNGIGDAFTIAYNVVSTVISSVISTIVSIIFSCYLLMSKDRLLNQFRRLMQRYLPHIWIGKINYVAHVFNKSFHRFFVGQTIEAVILGILCTIGMAILRLPYATMIGALIAFTALVPIAGAFIGAGIGALMILAVSPIQSLIFIAFIIILQQLEENLIYPRVVGQSTGLPGLWVLAAITIGGGIMGIFGMLIAVPIAAAFYRLIRHDVRKGEEWEAAMATNDSVNVPFTPPPCSVNEQDMPQPDDESKVDEL